VAVPGRKARPEIHPRTHRSNYRRGDARIAENGFATSSGVNKSAKEPLSPISVETTFQAAPLTSGAATNKRYLCAAVLDSASYFA
jgi:hypothetical protein